MSYFVLTFTRGRVAEPELERFEDLDLANERFERLEHELWGRRDRGVVLLIADSEETLRKTHTHYFVSSLDELLEQMTAAASA